eukprot:CAMPEP_0180317058 /NCGR_PEP_ID=MMETSP0988-20121125/33618_1 /TAXON_ID=697907 /ORGANISM="non described non described, Strain CCMP2293" /LENGTH=77 /DNA_ID=CAMNT_0022302255 /DNA_START=232 /DNA_END=465 /DNA_ORIENTATION=-
MVPDLDPHRAEQHVDRDRGHEIGSEPALEVMLCQDCPVEDDVAVLVDYRGVQGAEDVEEKEHVEAEVEVFVGAHGAV